jgi:Holliday junction resolvasome RuvABC endonuclease subunit
VVIPIICGIDYSLTCTGLALMSQLRDGPVKLTTGTVTSKGTRAASLPDRHERITTIGKEILHFAGKAELAVIEGLTPGAKGGSPVDRFAGWWFVVGGLIRRGVPVAVVAPTSLKLAIAGKGNADKAAVAVAVERLWPDTEITSSDVSDAVGLAHLGAVAWGWDVSTLERHRQVKWTEWPGEPVEGEAA